MLLAPWITGPTGRNRHVGCESARRQMLAPSWSHRADIHTTICLRYVTCTHKGMQNIRRAYSYLFRHVQNISRDAWTNRAAPTIRPRCWIIRTLARFIYGTLPKHSIVDLPIIWRHECSFVYFDNHFDRINCDAQPDPNSNPSSSLIHAANVEASVPQTPMANRPKITTARANVWLKWIVRMFAEDQSEWAGLYF